MVAAASQQATFAPAYGSFFKSLEGHYLYDIKRMVATWLVPNSPQLDHATAMLLKETLLYSPLQLKLDQMKREDLLKECLTMCAPYFASIVELFRVASECKLTSLPESMIYAEAMNPSGDGKDKKRRPAKKVGIQEACPQLKSILSRK